MICLCNKYPYQNTLEYKTNKRVGFQNNFKMRHESLGIKNKKLAVISVCSSQYINFNYFNIGQFF